MDLEELSLTAIKSLLAPQETVPGELLEALDADSRVQVKALGEQVRRKMEREGQERSEQKAMLELERTYHARGLLKVAGVDEVGRGPLAGPVVAAAVIFSPETDYPKARDSKKLTPEKREELYEEILQKAQAVGLGRAEHGEIDRLNIYHASLLAMYRAVENLAVKPDAALLDGPMVLRMELPQEALIKGDSRCLSIAAASIVAKVTRDRLMREYDRLYPAYGFARHKGYPTTDHFQALKTLGPCPIHRRSFSAVAACGSFSSPVWPFHYEALSRVVDMKELEQKAAEIRTVRENFSPEELNSLRALYRRKRTELRDNRDQPKTG